MTAAVARPPLFDHLVASRPERDRSSIGATAASLAMHGSVIVAIIVLGARVGAPASHTREPIVVLPPLIDPVQLPSDKPAGGPTGARRASRPAEPVPPAPIEVDVPPIPGDPFNHPIRMPGKVELVQQRAVTPIGRRAGGDDPPGSFQPVTELPRLLNRADVQRNMLRLYPQMLMQAGMGGTTIVWLRLDEEGKVIQTEIKKGSGQRALDDAALEVGKGARFSPALNGEMRVRVWVELPIVFTARD